MISKAESIMTREHYRIATQKKGPGGGGGAYYGQVSSKRLVLEGITDRLVELDEDLVLVDGAPKVDGWFQLLPENLKQSGAVIHTSGYARRAGYQNDHAYKGKFVIFQLK